MGAGVGTGVTVAVAVGTGVGGGVVTGLGVMLARSLLQPIAPSISWFTAYAIAPESPNPNCAPRRTAEEQPGRSRHDKDPESASAISMRISSSTPVGMKTDVGTPTLACCYHRAPHTSNQIT